MSKINLHVDDYNVLKAYQSYPIQPINKLDYLHSFHNDESLYEQSFEDYASYITYSVLSASIINDKSIESFESYVYNILKGYCTSTNKPSPTASVIAKIWNSILAAYSYIIELSSNPLINNISKFTVLFNPINVINTPKYFPVINFFFSPFLVFECNNKLEVLFVLPYMDNYSNNINIISSFKRYGSLLDKIHIVSISKGVCGTTTIDSKTINKFIKKADNMYLDTNQIYIPEHIKELKLTTKIKGSDRFLYHLNKLENK